MCEKENDNWATIPRWTRYEVNQYGILRNIKTKRILKQQDNHRRYKIYYVLKDEDNRHHILSKHRAVALAWIPNPQNFPIVNHKDENKLNCFFKNLEWCTYSYNNSYNEKALKNSYKLRKAFYLYNDMGDIVEEKIGIRDCCRTYNWDENSGSLFSALHFNDKNAKSLRSYKGFYPLSKKIDKEKFLERKNYKTTSSSKSNNRSKKVYQYTLDGELVACYNNTKKAAQENNISSPSLIATCCRGEIKQSHGFRWSYKKL